MNPEFLREGQAVMDFMAPDRIVLGGVDARTHDALETLYAPFGSVDKMRTSNRTAELIKYASNALLATLISFSNEIGNLAAALDDIDIVDVMKGVHLDKRFSPIRSDGSRIKPGFLSYLAAGCGFGGSCFPKDVRALIAHGREAKTSMRILDAVAETNEQQPLQMLQLLGNHLPKLDDKRVAVLGLAFKPGTDDVRESPALPIIQRLQERGAHVQAYDPIATENARAVLDAQHLTFCPDLEAALRGVDAVLLVTSWPEFERLPQLLDGRASQPVVVDGRRMLDPESVARYEGIGR
jgi:UDPglucose 6-dehydrogenase/GDP-mannose 6-dehydrogenase